MPGMKKWHTSEIEKLLELGIEFCRDEIKHKLLIPVEEKNLRLYVKNLLKINREYTIKQVGIKFFSENHKTMFEIKGIIKTLYLLGYGYHGKGIEVKKITDWQERFGEKNKKHRILDLDLWLNSIMNEVLEREGLKLDAYGEELERIRLQTIS